MFSDNDIKMCIATPEDIHKFVGGYKQNSVVSQEMEFGLYHMRFQKTDTTRQWSSAERTVNVLLKSVKAEVSILDMVF